jgi:hypothetical protein
MHELLSLLLLLLAGASCKRVKTPSCSAFPCGSLLTW